MGGPHHFQVKITTNDPDQKTLVFDVFANSIEPKP